MNEASITPDRNGIYRADAAQALYAGARAGGLAWFVIDVAGAKDKQGLLRTFAAALQFPGDFGMNWDAANDYLQDFSWQPAHGYVLEIRGAEVCAARLPDVWAMVVEILASAAAYWRSRGRTFVVLVHGLPALPAFAA